MPAKEDCMKRFLSAAVAFRSRISTCLFSTTGVLVLSVLPASAAIQVRTAPHATPREVWGAEHLRQALQGVSGDATILLAQRNSPLLRRYGKRLPTFWPHAEEAFILRRYGNTIIDAGYDPSGVLYGAMELADRIQASHVLPPTLDYEDHPALKLRGFSIGMQKPVITYEGAEYDYRYTPQNFPFFYNKAEWTQYLDMLAENRINTLYLWNGHPFTSLLKLPRYPEAQELSSAQLDSNIAMFRWLTQQADERGIWILQGFYNIHLSHSFARAHHLPYHLSAPTPLATQYTRYAISEFIRQYPHVGLMMTLGEALSPHLGAEWLKDAIIPGVLDGLREIHSTEEPPIVIRAHATDIEADLKAAMPMYSNIDTMFKWNGESFTWTNVRGPVRARFESLVKQSNVTVANVHLLSNLEPFRWGDPDFIRKTVMNFQKIGIGGVHVYPLRYWQWPITADKTNPPLMQIDRDWIWFDAWGRYAWNPDRDPQKEDAYWSQQFADRFGSLAAGRDLLRAYTLAGPAQPSLLPRIGITEGNRQAFALGMTMPEMIDAQRYGPAQTLWTGDAPNGERLDDYVAKEYKHLPHQGETPTGVADQEVEASAEALQAAEAAAPGVTKNRAEYERVVDDTRAIHLLMLFYQAKTDAALQVMLYGYDHNAEHLHEALPLLEKSVGDFRQLADLADRNYRDAAGLQTSQRRIPVRGGPDTDHWHDLLPVYQKELAIFRKRLAHLNEEAGEPHTQTAQKLPQVSFTLEPGSAAEAFTLQTSSDLALHSKRFEATAVDPSLVGMRGIRMDPNHPAAIQFTLSAPAQVLVGYFRHGGHGGPENTDAENWNPVLFNAVSATHTAPLTAWVKPLPAGENEIDLGRAAGVILGFVQQSYHMRRHSAPPAPGQPENLDWLFEN